MCILIIEDNAIQALTLEMIVKQLGFINVEKAYSPKQAYDKLLHFQPDLMLVDINLGTDQTGVDIVREVQKNHPVRVIYITGNSDSYHKKMADKTDYFGYMIKPIDPSQIKRILQREEILTS